jgi:hypothetical protein
MLRILVLVWVCLVAAIPSADAAKQAEKPVPVDQKAQSVPSITEAMVLLDGKPLFPINVQVLSFSPADRAKAISERIQQRGCQIVEVCKNHVKEARWHLTVVSDHT